MAELRPLSVNEAINRLSELVGTKVSIYGLLDFGFECMCVNHIPESEKRSAPVGSSRYAFDSSIWTNYEGGYFLEGEALRKFNRQQVAISGLLRGPEPDDLGCGHLGGWPAAIKVFRIQGYPEGEKWLNDRLNWEELLVEFPGRIYRD
jgi:hypothetical protein